VAETEIVIFDFDGTLLDSDDALLRPFDVLGIDRSDVVMGTAVAEECQRLGVRMEDYVAAYDDQVCIPYPGVEELLASLGRWAICSNKHPRSANAELDRLGWKPELVMCADAFGWRHKSLVPMLEALNVSPEQIVLVGDSPGDLRCATEVDCAFVWAGWNERVRLSSPAGVTARTPSDVLNHI
jgi:HAD superfamily hydrolase (TIGR01549 family)